MCVTGKDPALISSPDWPIYDVGVMAEHQSRSRTIEAPHNPLRKEARTPIIVKSQDVETRNRAGLVAKHCKTQPSQPVCQPSGNRQLGPAITIIMIAENRYRGEPSERQVCE